MPRTTRKSRFDPVTGLPITKPVSPADALLTQGTEAFNPQTGLAKPVAPQQTATEEIIAGAPAAKMAVQPDAQVTPASPATPILPDADPLAQLKVLDTVGDYTLYDMPEGLTPVLQERWQAINDEIRSIVQTSQGLSQFPNPFGGSTQQDILDSKTIVDGRPIGTGAERIEWLQDELRNYARLFGGGQATTTPPPVIDTRQESDEFLANNQAMTGETAMKQNVAQLGTGGTLAKKQSDLAQTGEVLTKTVGGGAVITGSETTTETAETTTTPAGETVTAGGADAGKGTGTDAGNIPVADEGGGGTTTTTEPGTTTPGETTTDGGTTTAQDFNDFLTNVSDMASEGLPEGTSAEDIGQNENVSKFLDSLINADPELSPEEEGVIRRTVADATQRALSSLSARGLGRGSEAARTILQGEIMADWEVAQKKGELRQQTIDNALAAIGVEAGRESQRAQNFFTYQGQQFDSTVANRNFYLAVKQQNLAEVKNAQDKTFQEAANELAQNYFNLSADEQAQKVKEFESTFGLALNKQNFEQAMQTKQYDQSVIDSNRSYELNKQAQLNEWLLTTREQDIQETLGMNEIEVRKWIAGEQITLEQASQQIQTWATQLGFEIDMAQIEAGLAQAREAGESAWQQTVGSIASNVLLALAFA